MKTSTRRGTIGGMGATAAALALPRPSMAQDKALPDCHWSGAVNGAKLDASTSSGRINIGGVNRTLPRGWSEFPQSRLKLRVDADRKVDNVEFVLPLPGEILVSPLVVNFADLQGRTIVTYTSSNKQQIKPVKSNAKWQIVFLDKDEDAKSAPNEKWSLVIPKLVWAATNGSIMMSTETSAGPYVVVFDLEPKVFGPILDEAQKQVRALKASSDAKQCKSGCFITTACCEGMGRADDCFELEALRRFRDRRLASMPGGRRDIETYYRVAPALVEAIAAGGGRRAFRSLYWRYVLPAAVLATLGLDRAARSVYTHMMLKLADQLEVRSLGD